MATKPSHKKHVIRNATLKMKGLLRNLCPNCKDMVEAVFYKYFEELEELAKEPEDEVG